MRPVTHITVRDHTQVTTPLDLGDIYELIERAHDGTGFIRVPVIGGDLVSINSAAITALATGQIPDTD